MIDGVCSDVFCEKNCLYMILWYLQVLTPNVEPLTEQQLREVCNLTQSCQQAEDALSQGMVKLHQILAEAVAAGRLGEGNYTLPQMGPAIEKLEDLVRFVNQVVYHIGFSFLSIEVLLKLPFTCFCGVLILSLFFGRL